jgi:3-hydroxymyristoyl/3-hydroxydecanoyl-(acyl carrier protein) dehydratase
MTPGAEHAGPFERVTIAGEAARAVVRAAHARALCAGHFPGDPILPGAHVAGLMAEVAAALVGGRAAPAEIECCTFLFPLRPDAAIEVLAARAGDAVEAEVRADGRPAARARLRFA